MDLGRILELRPVEIGDCDPDILSALPRPVRSDGRRSVEAEGRGRCAASPYADRRVELGHASTSARGRTRESSLLVSEGRVSALLTMLPETRFRDPAASVLVMNVRDGF